MIARAVLALAAFLGAAGAYAHFPTLDCQAQEGSSGAKLRCVAGFSDGSEVGEVELQIFSYDEELIEVVVTDARGEAVMPMPAGEFFIVFDANHETPAEFDYAELE